MEHRLTDNEAAPSLDISPDTLSGLVERDGVPARKIGGSWRLSRSRLEEFINAGPNVRRPRVLVIQPDLDECMRLLSYIDAHGIASQAVATFEEVDNLPTGQPWDIVFLAPQSVSGTLQGVARLREAGHGPRIVLMIDPGQLGDELAVLDEGPVIALRKPLSKSDVDSILTLVSA
ncbi:MAG: helix-turn-helix domain-containing protein [Chloroflexi bacterium]|nr:helix-turn-helix domain-containing protein [Chloroflexota bacterium]